MSDAGHTFAFDAFACKAATTFKVNTRVLKSTLVVLAVLFAGYSTTVNDLSDESDTASEADPMTKIARRRCDTICPGTWKTTGNRFLHGLG